MKLLLSIVSLLVLALVNVKAKPVDQSIRMNCLIKHLKASEMLAESYPNFPGPSTDDCTNLIDEATQVIFQSVISGLQMKNLQKYTSCVVSRLTEDKWIENNFLMIVYSLSRTLSEDEKKAKQQETLQKIQEISNKAVASCIFPDVFSELFDKLVTAANDVYSDPFQKYCERKYVIGNHLIDSRYNVILNPKNLDVSAANCEELLEQTKQGIDRSIVEKFSRDFGIGGSRTCAHEKFEELGFVDKIMAVFVLGETQLSDQQRQVEKKMFVEIATDIVEKADNCKA